MSSLHNVARRRARSGLSVVGKGVERRFDHLDLLGVDLPHRTEEPSTVGQCRRHQTIGVAELLRLVEPPPGGSRGTRRCPPGAGRCRGRSTGRCESAGSTLDVLCRPARAPGRSSARRRRERAPRGPRRRPAWHRRWPCPHRWAWWRGGSGGPVRPTPVVAVLPVEVLDGLAHGLVQPGAPRPTEVLVEGVLDEGVREAVAPGSRRGLQ